MERDAIDKYTAQWEKAVKQGIFKEKPRKTTSLDGVEDIANKDIDADYWNRIWELTHDYDDVPDPISAFGDDEEEGHDPSLSGDEPVVIQEGEEDWEEVQGVKVSKFDPNVDKQGPWANPISRSSRGKDNRSNVTPNWNWGVELAELTEMKVQLEKLESKMNAANAFAKTKEAKSVKKQIDELWDKIDALSDKLTPDFLRDYMS